jgi:hypothetical protein
VREHRCCDREDGYRNGRMSDRMLSEAEPARDVREHLVPAPVERGLEQIGMRETREHEGRNAHHNQRPQEQREHPDGRPCDRCHAVERDVMRGGG